MRLGRFLQGGREVYGALEGDGVRVLRGPEEKIPLEGLTYLPPVEPTKIVCLGLNYADHARELGMEPPEEPIIFLKPPTALVGHGGSIVYPKATRRLEYEAELALVMGARCKDVKEDEAMEMVLGYTVMNDVTARDLQKRDVQWTRAKSFDTFAPLGPYIVTREEIQDPHALGIELRLNGRRMQSSNTRNFIFPVPYIVHSVSEVMTLNPGDVISTGTPPGVGPMVPGDEVEIQVQGIGTLRNHVV
ncbi:MAG: fumarylacetoacetate hydrolase family protein [Candidatus Hydrothermarchaeota archaeon]